MSAQHTPGPWSVSELGADGEVSEYYIFIEPNVAVIERKSPRHDAHDMPDAHLLASAKVLLAALRDVLAAHTIEMPPAEAGPEAQNEWADWRAASRKAAEIAIAAATGSAS